MDQDLEQIDRYAATAIEMGMNYAPQLLLALVTLFVGLWIVNVLSAGAKAGFTRSGIEPTLQNFLLSLINVGLKALLVISVASMIGIETTSFIAVLGAAGLAIGLALQGSLANFAGGVLILMFRPFKVGDFIDGGGQMGSVQEIGIFHTVMTTGDNKTIIIPNGALSNSPITNYSKQATRRVDLVVGIDYGDDLRKAKEVILALIEADERILKDPAPLVVISSLSDSSVNITTRSWVDAANYWPVYFDLTENVKLAFDANGISIPFPQTVVHLYQASKP